MTLIHNQGIAIWFAVFGPLSLLASDTHELAKMTGVTS